MWRISTISSSRCENAVDRQAYAELVHLDIDFHDRVVRAANHGRLYSAWSSIKWQAALVLLNRRVVVPDYHRIIVAEHAQLLNVLRAGNPERASDAVEMHIAEAYARLAAGTTHPDTQDQGAQDAEQGSGPAQGPAGEGTPNGGPDGPDGLNGRDGASGDDAPSKAEAKAKAPAKAAEAKEVEAKEAEGKSPRAPSQSDRPPATKGSASATKGSGPAAKGRTSTGKVSTGKTGRAKAVRAKAGVPENGTVGKAAADGGASAV